MDKIYENGDKIQFMLPDKKGKAHWFDGLVHGVRRYEDPASNTITKVTYLIDTGRDHHVHEEHFDHGTIEYDRRIAALRAKGLPLVEAVGEVSKQTDLPPSKKDVRYIRQPEMIELSPDHIRPRE